MLENRPLMFARVKAVAQRLNVFPTAQRMKLVRIPPRELSFANEELRPEIHLSFVPWLKHWFFESMILPRNYCLAWTPNRTLLNELITIGGLVAEAAAE
jgi:hypothetical protein